MHQIRKITFFDWLILFLEASGWRVSMLKFYKSTPIFLVLPAIIKSSCVFMPSFKCLYAKICIFCRKTLSHNFSLSSEPLMEALCIPLPFLSPKCKFTCYKVFYSQLHIGDKFLFFFGHVFATLA